MTAIPLWARVLRHVTVWGSATLIAVGAYIGAMIAVSAFLDDRPDVDSHDRAAAALRDDVVYVDQRAANLLDQATLAEIEKRAAGMSQPTRVVVWPRDGEWLGNTVEYIAARSDVESRFLIVDPWGLTKVASTLPESEPSVPDTLNSPVAAALTEALDKLERTPVRGERTEYDDGGGLPGEQWLAAAAGAGLALFAGFTVLSGVVVAFSTVLLVVMFAALAVVSYRRRKAGPAIAHIEARPAERRQGRNQVVYRPPNDVLVRINKVRITERAELLRDELLALGERMAESTDRVDGPAWALALDCYAVAGRIADTVEGRDDLAAQADVVAGLVLVARGRRAADAAEADREPTETVDCFANPFHGAAVGPVPAISLGTERPPASVPQRVEVCATCRAAAAKSIAVADPLVLDAGSATAYWMAEVRPWSEIGYGAPGRDLIDAWNRSRV
ncbi:hypothetical protein [Kribbella shirazensis]|uniref:Uncharacterized protein n=1 Tax=Kribbella shirazensis TaxID=1105143 RepID=A0A7X5V9I9_9ACTN|nr:hypothetical protein [Kribbella shirazensis]NIK56452.1 hypothetical protein [Kribbella shirazensis]